MREKNFWILAVPLLVLFLGTAGPISGQEKGKPPQPTLLEYEAEGKTPVEIATWIYEHHGCSTCHHLTPYGLEFTPQGQAMAAESEGCIGMMTTVRQTVTLRQSRWTKKQRKSRDHFVRFGCSVCHQMGAKNVELTPVGAKAGVLHMSCPGVISILGQAREK